jgi:hypothetical protein
VNVVGAGAKAGIDVEAGSEADVETRSVVSTEFEAK